ncbi:Uncharacterized protein Adt_04224 [Abeliophyllum distichum]|uniref:DUF4283 domain-containing protein n=1 Tax=Abeliophyllum distichum TaxID=126358 RepID=A0ABD1W165_9LAMI
MGCPMRILKWTCDFHPDAEMSIGPVWISFLLLLVQLHTNEILFSLSKIFGVPLRIDKATVDLLRPNEARVCVEINLEHKLPDRIWIDRTPKLAVTLAHKPFDVQVSIIARTGKDKRKEIVVEAPRQWAPIVGSSSIVDIPPPVVHVETTHQPKHTIPITVASKPFHDIFFVRFTLRSHDVHLSSVFSFVRISAANFL